MSSRPRKLLLLLPVLAAALALSACGNSQQRVTTGTYAGEAGAGAPYLDVGPLIYEVQLSRALNPANSGDAAYLEGLTAQQRKLAPGEEWFAVFLQVYNHTSSALPASSDITISDTQHNSYSQIVPGPVNQFAYRAGTVPAKGQIPVPGTTAADDPAQGLVLLFKIQLASLENRPLEIKIVDAEGSGEAASAELDV